MSSTAAARADVFVTAGELATVRNQVDSAPAGLAGFSAVMTDGTTRQLSPELSTIIDKALRSLAANGTVTVGTMPEELTSNTAADFLGISRPTLLRLARAGDLESFKVGTHTRFKREAVMKFKAEREAARRVAMGELLDLEDQLDTYT